VTREGQTISRGLVVLFAFATGATVANIYYVQPLLNVLGHDFGVTDTAAGMLVTCTQVGYVIGLAVLVPLGDLRERRRLVSVLLVGAGAALAACAAAPSFAVLAVGLVAVGVLSGVAQILVPLAATLAAPQQRGQVVGSVMTGLLIGILGARVISGRVAEFGGWQLIFELAAVVMVALALLLHVFLPRIPPKERMSYPAVLGSVFELIAAEPLLRQRMALGVFQMACFTVLWTSIAFLLGGPPYDYGEGTIGLFGLAGMAGALVAPLAGRWADRGHGRLALTVFQLAALVSWALIAAGSTSLAALIAGIILLDFGTQGAQISNQSTIYSLRASAHSRLTTAYMVSRFVGGVMGSLLSASVYGAAGWSATCALGATFAALGLALWAGTQRVQRGAQVVEPSG
jgi:predicted MFS family arabinose efflux permease